MYTLYKETQVATTKQNAWAFISNPANLNLITPEDMAFEIRSELPDKMFEGMLVEYRVKIPLIGTQLWLSELKHIVPGESFVDEQKIGPYKLWYHYHGLEAVSGGIKVIDRVTYAVPFGLMGKTVHALFIRRTLDRIFEYRTDRLTDLLG